MPGFGNTFRKDLNQYIFRGTALPNAITTLYISLHTADPGPDGQTANEVSGGSYARVSRAQGTTDWAAATTADPSTISNATVVTFPTATASWGTVTHFGIWNSSTLTGAANFIGAGALTASQSIGNGNTASFAVGALTHSFDSV